MKNTGDNIAAFLRSAATKIEELQVQSALGKAELSDKLENIKSETQKGINQIKANLNASLENNKDRIDQVKAKLQHLEVQLALAKAETKDEIAKQKKVISDAFHDVKHFFTK